MQRTRWITAIGILFVLSVVAAFVFTRDDPSSGDTVDLASMTLTQGDVRAMTRTTMGTSKLGDVPSSAPTKTTDLASTLEGNVRTFTLTAKAVRWEYRDGQYVAAWAYDGQVPGPTLRATEGETVRVKFHNALPVATTVHWHGVNVPWTQDGVPGVSQEPIRPGDDFTYQFTATPAGTRWYHTHGSTTSDEASQLDMGLSGAIVIAPRHAASQPDVDRTLVLDDWNIGAGGYNAAMLGGHAGHNSAYNVFTINGRSAPDTSDIVVDEGDTVRLRFVNASSMSYHPMHLHGHQFRIVALDGNPVANPVTRNVALLAPGETADVEFVADNPGVWMLHCHDLHHADAGMTMLIRYRGYQPVSTGTSASNDEAGAAGSESMPGMSHG